MRAEPDAGSRVVFGLQAFRAQIRELQQAPVQCAQLLCVFVRGACVNACVCACVRVRVSNCVQGFRARFEIDLCEVLVHT